MNQLDDLTDDEVMAYLKKRKAEKEREEKRRMKNKARLAERLAKEEAKEVARKKLLDEAPLRKEESKLKVIKRKQEFWKKQVEEREAKDKAEQEKLDKATTPIKIGEELVLNDLVDEILTTYTPAVKRAIYKHRANNIEKYNTYLREYTQRKMLDPEFARYKKEQTAKSNEKVRLRKLAEREALQKKIILIKTEHSVPDLNIIIQASNGN